MSGAVRVSGTPPFDGMRYQGVVEGFVEPVAGLVATRVVLFPSGLLAFVVHVCLTIAAIGRSLWRTKRSSCVPRSGGAGRCAGAPLLLAGQRAAIQRRWFRS